MKDALYILGGLITFFLFKSLKIAQDQERFACFNFGQFKGLKGPGILLKFLGDSDHWERLRLGDRGELLSPEIARFHNTDVPIISHSALQIGSIVQITGFEKNRIIIDLSPNQSKSIRCPKCGHEIAF